MSSVFASPDEWIDVPRYRHVREDIGHAHSNDPGLDPSVRLWERRTLVSDRSIEVMAGQVEVLLEKSPTDWRKVSSIAREIEATVDDVHAALRALGDKVRTPVGATAEEADWYRLVSKGLTKREQWRLVRAVISRTPIVSHAEQH